MFGNRCPFCKEKIKSNAVICKHCKSSLPRNNQNSSRSSLLKNKYFWVFVFFLFIVGMFNQEDDLNKNNTVNNNDLIVIAENKESVNDKLLFKKDGYAGDFRGCEKSKVKGSENIKLWVPFANSMQGLAAKYGRVAPIYKRVLVVNYDEIWTTKKSGSRNSDNYPDINKLYFYKNKIMATTSSRYYDIDPVTKQYINDKGYKIITANTRDELIEGINSWKK